MEGHLKLWTGILGRWKRTYFILHDNILVYCKEKGDKAQGSIHLKISSITLIPDDPLRIIINSGTKEINIRASTIGEKIKWVNALRNAQEEAFKEIKEMPDLDIVTEEDKAQNEEVPTIKPVEMKKIDEELAEIWCNKAYLDEILSMIAPQIQRNQPLFESLEKIQNYCHQLKKLVTNCVKYIEDEKRKLFILAKHLEARAANLGRHVAPLVNSPEKSEKFSTGIVSHQQILRKNSKFLNFTPENNNNVNGDETVFESFLGGDEHVYYKNLKKKSSFLNNNLNTPLGSNNAIILNNAELNEKADLPECIQEFKSYYPLKYDFFLNNLVWNQIPTLLNATKRFQLPYLKDPNQKLNIWNLLKDMIGKDLSRFAVPVYLNEPLSMLQRLAEQFEYSELIEEAVNCADSCERMAYIMILGLAPYSSTIGRNNKPFNPLLGETYELIDKEKNFRFLSEQVSHHPPISAGYCENDQFEFWSNTNVKTTFWGASLEVKPLGPSHLKLKNSKDHYIWNKAKTSVNGIILGKLYVDNFGEMTYDNVTTRESGKLILKQRGWGDRGAYETTGFIKDASGKERFTLKGRWDKEFTLINSITKVEKIIWRKNALSNNANAQYNLTKFAIELNHLTPELLKHLPITDSRLRPDQKALEMGWIELANTEKLRLEDKQRAKRKENEKVGRAHTPKWFEERTDNHTGQKEYFYIGKYWEAREKGVFHDLLDLY